MPITITGLYVYPVKSFAGIAMDACTATLLGLEGDRQWAVFKEDGHALTQRQKPGMAQIFPAFTNKGLLLQKDGMASIEIEERSLSRDTNTFKVWKDDTEGSVASSEVGKWLAEALDYDGTLTLAKCTAKPRDFIDPPRFGVSGNYFSDAAPYLVANEASLSVLNQHLSGHGEGKVDMRHFRPNIIIDGIAPWDEHAIGTLTDHDSVFTLSMVDHCQRCVMITVDPDQGQLRQNASPFKRLADLNGMPDNAKAPAFGVNASLKRGDGFVLRVGQQLQASNHY